MKAFWSAVEFLTRLPAPAWVGWEDGRLDRAAGWFWAVGALIGLAGGAVFFAAVFVLPPLTAALLALATTALLTGGLHEDGLADCADGFAGGQTIERRLEIMRDSRIGAHGAVALILILGLQASALAEISPLTALLSLIAGHSISRAAMLIAVKRTAYARPSGAPLSRTASFGIIPALFLLTAIEGIGAPALIPGAIALGLGWLAARIAVNRFGGWTGDTLGATQQVCMTAYLIGVAAWT